MIKRQFHPVHCFLLSCLISCFTSCLPPVIHKAPHDKTYIIRNKIEVKEGKFTKAEKTDLQQRLFNQIDDSAKVNVKDILFLLQIINRPPALDSSHLNNSAENMKASLFHSGYYHAAVGYKIRKRGKKAQVTYTIDARRPTLIEGVKYDMSNAEMQQLAVRSAQQAYLKKNNPITKADILSEVSRLVDTFRNNGFYKITAAELRVIGDTTLSLLTSVSNDPFEQLQLLSEAQQKKDSPQIRISIEMNAPSDSSRLTQYRIRTIHVLPDYRQGDLPGDSGYITNTANNIVIHSHQRLFRLGFIIRNISLQAGQVFRQQEYYRTITSLVRTGVWQSVNLRISEIPDSTGWLDIIAELSPNRKFGFETSLESSYLSTTNATSALAGNLFGLSMNLSLTNRNLGREAIRMTHLLRAGIELNNNRGLNAKTINSNELSYTNNISIPKMLFPALSGWLNPKGESFINTSVAFNNRLSLFTMQTYQLNLGWNATLKNAPSWKVIFRPLNAEFNYLFNPSDSFSNILKNNPFLRFSYNTSYVAGMSISFLNFHKSLPNNVSNPKERYFRLNLEESGLTWGNLPFLKNYLRRYVKMDAEWKYSITYPKTILAFRGFIGVGIPLLGSDSNKTLPFFKQFFGGGINSMRGWPARGIGIGGQARIPFTSSQTIFNDRTGDFQLEGNAEYRYEIARIIPNTLTLRGALFVDIGNVWNIRNLQPFGKDSAQFTFSNLYRQLGLSAGTGFRIDFNYVVLRLDLGFRFKRPDLFFENAGWKAPAIGFDDFFQKMFTRGPNGEYRKWRYDNFNFNIGISYPF